MVREATLGSSGNFSSLAVPTTETLTRDHQSHAVTERKINNNNLSTFKRTLTQAYPDAESGQAYPDANTRISSEMRERIFPRRVGYGYQAKP